MAPDFKAEMCKCKTANSAGLTKIQKNKGNISCLSVIFAVLLVIGYICFVSSSSEMLF